MSMVDRVAAAICLADLPDHTWDEIDPQWQAKYRGWARLAIEAMREPTDAMLDAMPRLVSTADVGREIWHNAIDAALAVVDSSTDAGKPK